MNYLEIAGRKGAEFAADHPYADGATAWQWAMRWFSTKAECRAFLTSWRSQA